MTAGSAWDAMYADCARAKASIAIEQYIIEDDSLGKRFLHLFMELAQKGVRVRMLCDMVGSSHLYNNTTLLQALRKSGVEIIFYNPISFWRVNNYSSVFFRDHRKILIVDSEVGHIGGVGLRAAMHDWRDTHVCLTGEVVLDMARGYDRAWQSTPTQKFLKFDKPGFRGPFTYTTNSPRVGQRFIYHSFLRAIRAAKQYIYITTPYFVPDLKLFNALRAASRRRVSVCMLLPKNSDHAIVDMAGRSYFALAMKAGVRFFLYHKTILHAKAAVIDDLWSTVGSTNLDNISLVFNQEGNVQSINPFFSLEIKKQFLADLLYAEEVKREKWKARPWSQKVLEAITWPIHKIL